jgi:hypothetical protein
VRRKELNHETHQRHEKRKKAGGRREGKRLGVTILPLSPFFCLLLLSSFFRVFGVFRG